MAEVALTDALEQVQADPQVPVQPESQEAIEQYLGNLVGEGKKYTSAEALAKAYHHSSLHIEELKSDLDEYKGGKELLNEVLTEIRNSSSEEVVEAAAPPYAPVENHNRTEDVAKIVDDKLNAREQVAKATANVATSMDALTKLYGSDSKVKVAVTQAINGDSAIKDTIDDLSRRSPDAMVKFVTGLVPVQDSPAANLPGVNTGEYIAPPQNVGLTWSQCRDVKKNDPSLYNSAVFRKRIEVAADAAASVGNDFFAT
tara:strand:- start:1822 stop:2592 length:771 start_codon:yes stop_codon:yes gene_type:complete